MQAKQPDELSAAQAAAFIEVPVKILSRWRKELRGPPYRKPKGSRAAFYKQADLVPYRKAKEAVRSFLRST